MCVEVFWVERDGFGGMVRWRGTGRMGILLGFEIRTVVVMVEVKVGDGEWWADVSGL